MRRPLVVDGDLHVGRDVRVWRPHHGFRWPATISGYAFAEVETSAPEFLRLAARLE